MVLARAAAGVGRRRRSHRRQQAAPKPTGNAARPTPHRLDRSAAAARGKSGPDQRNRKADRASCRLPLKGPSETIEDFNARAKEAAKDASDGLSRLTTSLDGQRPRGVSGSGQRRAGLQGGFRQTVPEPKASRKARASTTDSAQTCSAKVLIRAASASRTIAAPKLTSPARYASSKPRDSSAHCWLPIGMMSGIFRANRLHQP